MLRVVVQVETLLSCDSPKLEFWSREEKHLRYPGGRALCVDGQGLEKGRTVGGGEGRVVEPKLVDELGACAVEASPARYKVRALLRSG